MALLDASVQSQKEGDGDPVHLLRHPHGECSAAGRKVDGTTTDRGRIVEPLKPAIARLSRWSRRGALAGLTK